MNNNAEINNIGRVHSNFEKVFVAINVAIRSSSVCDRIRGFTIYYKLNDRNKILLLWTIIHNHPLIEHQNLQTLFYALCDNRRIKHLNIIIYK